MDTPPVSLLLIAHAPLASALAVCAQHVYPQCANAQTPTANGGALLALDIAAADSFEASLARALALLPQLPAPLLILTDLSGATPARVAQALLQQAQTRLGGDAAALLCGANLSMLLRALCYRREALPQLCQRALDGARSAAMLLGAA